MKITGFKLLKDGKAGIEVEGVDLVESGVNKVMFRDNVKRTRNFPLSPQLRNAVNVLRYPFLVGTEYWQSTFASYMKEDFSRPDRKDMFINSPDYKRLINMWDSVTIQRCVIENGSYKVTGELNCEMSIVKAVVLIHSDNDHSLYSFVQEALTNIVDMIDQTLSLPQIAIGGGQAIREIIEGMHGEDIPDDMTDEEAFITMVRTAQKKGYGIVLDDNSLAQLTIGLGEGEDENDIPQIPILPQFTETEEDLTEVATVVSSETSDEGIFQQQPEEEVIL